MQFQVIWFSYLWMHLVVIYICDDIKNTTVLEGSKRNSSVILEGSERKASVIKGDFMIGAIFPIHDSPMDFSSLDLQKCGVIREYYGIHRVEAALYTIDRINNCDVADLLNSQGLLNGIVLNTCIETFNIVTAVQPIVDNHVFALNLTNMNAYIKNRICFCCQVVLFIVTHIYSYRDESLLPNITLGIDIRDGCWSSLLALEQTIKLIENSVPDEEDSSGTCANDSINTKPLIAIVGPGPSESTIQVQNLLQLFHIPQIGYSATSSDLSDKNRYSYFFRVVPPDSYQVQIIIELLIHYGWTYVSFVYSDDNYGQSGATLFSEFSKYYGICIAKSLQLSRGDVFYTDEIVEQLSSDENVKVVICFCDGQSVEMFLDSIRRSNLTNRFIFIGSDAWVGRRKVLETMQDELDGSIIISIDLIYADEFDPYYFARTPATNDRNPWFTEFWQYKFNCTFDTKLHPGYHICSGKEDLKKNFQQDSKVPAVIKCIYILALSLHKMVSDVCGKNAIPCSQLYPFNGTMFKEYIADTNFTYKGEEVSFDIEYDPVAQYQILNYQKLRNGTYKLVQIGSWKANFTLEIWGEAKFNYGKTTVSSVCSSPCDPGYRKYIETRGSQKECCWLCLPCTYNEILLNETVCEPCRIGYWPNENKTMCEKINPTRIQWDDIQSIVSLTLSLIGIILTIITAIFFVRYSDTPVVKASTKELCYFMLFGMCLAHCVSIAVISAPSNFSCAISRILPGISFSIVYGSLLVKTNRIARILAISKKKFPNMKPRFMSTTAQISISTAIITVELIICILLLVSEPASPRLYFPTPWRVVLKCNTSDQALVLPLLFDAILVMLCTLYAVKTRNIPSNFNEAKFIGFSMYTTCITWVAFGLIYYGSNLKVVTQCVSISVNALVILVFLFFPKLYVIIFHPEKNTRANFTTSKGIRCFIGNTSSTCSNNSQSVRSSNLPSDFENEQYVPAKVLKNKPKIKSSSSQTSTELWTNLLHSAVNTEVDNNDITQT